jgi:hypothetical protein
VTAVASQATDLRDCRLYRFWVRHPRTGRRVLGYIGETVRLPFERLMEHVEDQPWADTVVAWEVDDRVFAGKDAVLAAEAAAIRAERPLYNFEENQQNRLRVPIPRAVEQRHARDDAAGRPRWIPPKQRKPDVAVSRPESAVTGASVSTYRLDPRRWRPWQQKLVLWSLAWIGATAVIAADLRRLGCVTAPWYIRPLCAGLLVAAVLVGSLWMNRRRWKRIVRMVRWLARLAG